MALSDKQRIAMMAKAVRDRRNGESEDLVVPDPTRKTYIDEHGRKYWLGTGYHGRSIKLYGEPWKFRTTVWDIVGLAIVVGLVVLGILDTVFDIV